MSPTGSTNSNQAAAGSSSPTASTTPADPLASESTFLTLLVSQLQNQDPLSPVDSNTFVSQLTEYSQLEQLMGINQNTNTLATDAGAATSATATSATPTTGTTQPTTGA
jgi:flagellar basal-body rod modification protein FlgD